MKTIHVYSRYLYGSFEHNVHAFLYHTEAYNDAEHVSDSNKMKLEMNEKKRFAKEVASTLADMKAIISG